MSYFTIRSRDSKCVDCGDCGDEGGAGTVYTLRAAGLADRILRGYTLDPHCVGCYTDARGETPKSSAALWAARDAAARAPFEKNLTHDLDPLED